MNRPFEFEWVLASAATPSDRDVVIVAGRDAYDVWRHHNVYRCQPNRTFRQFDRMGFYHQQAIQPHLPRRLDKLTAVTLSELATSNDAFWAAYANAFAPGDEPSDWQHGETFDVYRLSAPDDDRTINLKSAIRHVTTGRGSAFTQHQRYVPLDALLSNPPTTDGLI